MKVNTYLEQEVDLEKLIKELRISEDDIERAALKQPKLYLEASRYRVNKLRVRSARFAKLEVAKAELGIKLRRQSHSSKEKKLTEAALNEIVVSNPKYRLLRKKLERAFAEEEFAKSLQESYRQRKDAIRIIADIRNAEISQEIRQARSQLAYDETRKMSEQARRRAEELERD